jgi:hypothetical protein
MTVEQFLPSLHYGDAVGNSALALHRFLLSRGVGSRIIALNCDASVKDQATLFSDYRLDPDSVKILRFAIPSPLTDFFLGLNGKKVLIYHNITPSRFFAGYSASLVHITTAGREQLKKLNRCFDLSIGDSSFNSDELRELGFANVRVFPLLVNLEDYGQQSSRSYAALLKNERKNIRRPHFTEQENRRPDQGGFFLQEIHFAGRAPYRGREYRFSAEVLPGGAGPGLAFPPHCRGCFFYRAPAHG